MASSEGPLCVGCAKDLALCGKSRRKLGSDSRAADQETRADVLALWRELCQASDLREVSNCDEALLRMCSSCFNDYSKFCNLRKKIASNMESAAERLVVDFEASAGPSKKARVVVETPVVVREGNTAVKPSPPVLVRKYDKKTNKQTTCWHS